MSATLQNHPHQTGFVHPGQMGVTIAAAVRSNGHEACWASADRSDATLERALQYQLTDLGNLEKLCSDCVVVFSVCPPDQATTVAGQLADCGFSGIYVDCNAVSPNSAGQVGDIVTAAGASFVDGGIIGPPAINKGTTRLYLSGDKAPEVASLFPDSNVDARVISENIGSASALKMAYAGWTKGSTALLLNQIALARQQQVEEALLAEWKLSIPGLVDKLARESTSNAPKAWRFVGEMNEIADTLQQAGLSRQWFEGAAETYARLAHLKNRDDLDKDQVISALLTKE